MAPFLLVHWLVIGSIGVIFTSILGLLLLRFLKKDNRSYWLTTFIGLGLAWLLIIISRLGIPHEIDIGNWQSNIAQHNSLFTSSPTLLLDDFSWAFSLTVISLGICAVMTAVSNIDELNWTSLFGILMVTFLGVFAVQAGNPLSVLLFWTALDLAELVFLLSNVRENKYQKPILFNFIFRFFGSLVLLGLVIYSEAINSPFAFGIFPIQFSLPLLISVGVRLAGEIYPVSIKSGGSFAGMLWLVPLAANLSLLVRVAQIGIPDEWGSILLFLVIGIFFIVNYQWLGSENEDDGRSFWLLSLGSVSMLAAIQKSPESSLIWGISGLLFGGILFLGRIRLRSLVIFPILAVFSMSLLPFSPTWRVSTIFSGIWEKLPMPTALIAMIIFIAGYSFYILGYLRHGLRIENEEASPERWVWLLYIPGLVLLVLLNFALGWINLPDLNQVIVLDWVIGILICLVVIAELVMQKRYSKKLGFGSGLYAILRKFSIPSLINRIFVSFYQLSSRLIALVNSILEGEGGLLWAYLILVMLISLALQFGLVR